MRKILTVTIGGLFAASAIGSAIVPQTHVRTAVAVKASAPSCSSLDALDLAPPACFVPPCKSMTDAITEGDRSIAPGSDPWQTIYGCRRTAAQKQKLSQQKQNAKTEDTKYKRKLAADLCQAWKEYHQPGDPGTDCQGHWHDEIDSISGGDNGDNFYLHKPSVGIGPIRFNGSHTFGHFGPIGFFF